MRACVCVCCLYTYKYKYKYNYIYIHIHIHIYIFTYHLWLKGFGGGFMSLKGVGSSFCAVLELCLGLRLSIGCKAFGLTV